MPKPKKAHQTSFETPAEVFSAVAGIKPAEPVAETEEIAVETAEVTAEETPVQNEPVIEEPVEEPVAEVTPEPEPAPVKEVLPPVPTPKPKPVQTDDGTDFKGLLVPSKTQRSAVCIAGKIRVVPAEPASVVKAWDSVKDTMAPAEFLQKIHQALGCPNTPSYCGVDLDFLASMNLRDKLPGAEYVELK